MKGLSKTGQMNHLIRIAASREVISTSLSVALVVGTILVAINYGDRIIARTVTRGDVLKMLLTYCVPYMVSTYASVKAISQRAAPRHEES